MRRVEDETLRRGDADGSERGRVVRDALRHDALHAEARAPPMSMAKHPTAALPVSSSLACGAFTSQMSAKAGHSTISGTH
jgi:hypothetical protein